MKRIAFLFSTIVVIAAACGGSGNTNDEVSTVLPGGNTVSTVFNTGQSDGGTGGDAGDTTTSTAETQPPSPTTSRTTTPATTPPPTTRPTTTTRASGGSTGGTPGTCTGDPKGGVPTCTNPTSVPRWQTTYVVQAKDRQPDSQGILPRVVFPVYTSPNGSIKSLPSGYDLPQDPWVFGGKFAALVLSGEPGDEWVKILLSTKPSSEGWVRAQDFDWIPNNHHVTINVTNNTIAVYNGNELLYFTGTIDGRSSARTPVARTYIEDFVPNTPSGPIGYQGAGYGTYIIPLALYSEDLVSFGTSDGVQGLPQIAIHGTRVPEQLGESISSGCIRMHNDIINKLVETVPRGTVVDIVI